MKSGTPLEVLCLTWITKPIQQFSETISPLTYIFPLSKRICNSPHGRVVSKINCITYHLLIKSWHSPTSPWIIYLWDKFINTVFYSLILSQDSPQLLIILTPTSPHAQRYKNTIGHHNLVSDSLLSPTHVSLCKLCSFLSPFFPYFLSPNFLPLPPAPSLLSFFVDSHPLFI